jgi:predicted RNA binding protein YcfA (HicA-like mRNA interferase family)
MKESEARVALDSVIKGLRLAAASVKCKDLAKTLTSLGFEVRNGRKSGHKVYVHHGLTTFTTGGYTCGHGKNPEIKPVYVKKVAANLENYKSELIQYLGRKK